MCFRPAEASAPQVCPECGAEIAVIAGIKQKNCPFCNAVLPADDPKPAAAAPTMAPNTPASPAAPAAPSAPVAPKPATVPSEAKKTSSAPTQTDNKPFNPFNR